MANVALSDVRKSFDKTEVIHGIDMDIAPGEFIVLVGPSGCGKSTLLRMIAGLEQVSDGEITIDGQRMNDVEPRDRDIAMVFQNYALYPHMSVYNNMAYGLKNRRFPRDQIAARVQEAARILRITDLLDRRPRDLSGGQRQRVAMGRAIVRQPAVFLFDEPLSNLDAKLRVDMRVEIRKLHERLGVTSVYVTHDQVEAMTLADRLVVMNAGRAEQIGRPIDVYHRPATTFVADFIGSPAMNFLSAEITPDGTGVRLASGEVLGLSMAVPDYPAGAEITLGIRPETLTLHDEAAATGRGLTMTVDMFEPLGADTLVHGHVGDDTVTLRVAGTHSFEKGRVLHAHVGESDMHLFDPKSGQRVPKGGSVAAA